MQNNFQNTPMALETSATSLVYVFFSILNRN